MGDAYAVIVPSAGSAESLGRTVRSIRTALLEAGAGRTSIVVVDDAQFVRSLGPDLGMASVHVIDGGHRGAGPARNLGSLQVDSEWLVFVDDDIEVDAGSIQALQEGTDTQPDADVFLGTLRPPEGATTWLVDAYVRGVIAPQPRPGRERVKAGAGTIASGLLAIRRGMFERVGGYADLQDWGLTDVLLGLQLQKHGARVLHLPRFSGVHHYLPTWTEWLDRRERAGQRFAALVRQLPAEDAKRLSASIRLAGGPRSLPKRLAVYLPPAVCRQARTRWFRRLAAAGMEARAFRRASDGRR